jgi:hypothetical protein
MTVAMRLVQRYKNALVDEIEPSAIKQALECAIGPARAGVQQKFIHLGIPGINE